MSSFPFIFLFSSTMITSTFIALSASHWLMIWMALELNMISFLPLITSSLWLKESEAAIKYLFFQALGSNLFLLGSASENISFLLIVGLLVKLGTAPFHFWLPQVANALSWPICLTFLTWQKIIPLAIIISTISKSMTNSILAIASLSALIGGLGGMNQTQLRSLLAYSSIGHMGWMLATASVSPMISLVYFLVYSSISLTIFYLLMVMDKTFILSLNSLLKVKPLLFTLLVISMLSLSGLPPLTGFIPKWLVLSSIQSVPSAFMLILGSLMNLYFYLNVLFSAFMLPSSPQTSLSTLTSKSSFLAPLIIFTTALLPVLIF